MTTKANAAAPTSADLDAALLLLSRLGISPDDLRQAAPTRPPAPDVRRVRSDRVRRGQRGDAPGLRLVLEPGRRHLG
jgi:hypothetical protein